ncbi:alpha/beta hydrolase [Limosilactobacillus sp.]|uniref:alpha/beta hydrolase n=1 Tax=Limosilactobacillus sp. TaxID=2773925 RepID=UPI00345EB705
MIAVKYSQIKIQQLRQEWKKGDDLRDAGLDKHPMNVHRLDNLSYGSHGKYNLLDLYLPNKLKGPLPVIINIHGGGYFYATKETYQFYGLMMAQKGFAFVNFNYQLAPDVQYPSEINEVNQVFQWVAMHGKEYNLDLNNVFVVGDSAGGQMAEQYLVAYSNPVYRGMMRFSKPNLTIRAGLLNCGCYFLPQLLAQPSLIDIYFSPVAKKRYQQQLRVEDYVTEDFLPVFIMTANNDFLRDVGIHFDKLLNARRIEHEFKIYGSPDHSRNHVFHFNLKNDPIAKQCNDDEIAFLLRHINK